MRSANGNIISARKPAINGLHNATMTATGTTNRFNAQTQFNTYSTAGSGPVSRGFIRPKAEAIPGGCRLNIDTFHQTRNDRITMYLMAEVFDAKTNRLEAITLSVLTNGESINGSKYRGHVHFDLNYDEINAFLKSKSPHLSIVPGQTNLAVAARWNNGHQAGGFQRGGVFRLPGRAPITNVQSVRGKPKTDETDLPLDMQLAFPSSLTQSIPALKDDGNILSRLESELKGEASKAEMTSAITKMYEMVAKAEAGDPSLIKKMLGDDWTASTVNRYWLKDDGKSTEGTAGTGYFKGFRVDADNLPMQDPMRDTYMDDDAMRMTQHEGAIRLRTNKQATVMNIKPGGGRLDNKTKICQRIEYGYEMDSGTSATEAGDAMRRLDSLQSGTIFNSAQDQATKLDTNLDLSQALDPWLEVVQDRHKFTLTNEKTGVEIELSLDKVKATTLRDAHRGADGKPQTAEFYVLEAELDHLQLTSNNTVSGAAVTNNARGGSIFTTNSQQDQWLSALSNQATMNLDPRLHELDDLNNDSFRATLSYDQFETATAKLLPALFPQGLGHGRQKAAHAAEVLGVVLFDKRAIRKAVKAKLDEEGYDWTPAMAKFIQKQIEDGRGGEIQGAFHDLAGHESFASFLDYDFSLPRGALKFSASKLKARFKKRLNEIGFDSSADVNKLLERFKTSQIAPDELESILEDLETQNDDTLLSDLTQAIGLSRVPPSPRRNLKSLFESTTEIGRIVENAHLPKNEYAQLKSFSEDCLAAGAQMSDIRSYLTDFDSVDVQEITEHMANNYGVSPIPVFHLDEAHVLAQVKAQLINANLVFDAATTTTLKSLTTQVPYDEMKDFINALKYQHQIPGQFSKFAKKHGVAASALKPDLPSSHAHLKSYAKKALIGYNASFSKVVEKLLLNGTTVGSVENLLDALTKDPDLKAALSKAKIDLPSGTRLPKVDYDDDATAAFAFAKMPTAMQQMVSSSRFEKAIAKCLRAGLSPKESTDFMKRYYKDGRASAVKKSGVADGKLPDFPVDANAVAREFKKRFGKSAFTTAHSKYVREAFPKALGDGAFQPDAWVQTLPTILAKLEASSGIKAP